MKDQSDSSNPTSLAEGAKEDFCALLENLSELLELSQENPFRIRALKKAAQTLRDDESLKGAALHTVAAGKVKIPGVGEGVRAYLKEFLETGNIGEVAEVKSKIPEAVFVLIQLPGLGAKKSLQLVTELGIQNLGELEYACRENRLLTLKGFGPATQIRLLEAIERFKNQKGKFLLPDALDVARNVLVALKKNKALPSKDSSYRLCGGLSRKAEIVESLEILVHSEELDAKNVTSSGFEILHSETIKKFSIEMTRLEMGVAEVMPDLKVVLWLAKKTSPSLLAWLDASEKVRLLNESHAVWSSSLEPTALEPEWCVASERALRVHAKPATFYFRIKSGPVKGVFHNHTNSSDGAATLQEMVKAAQDLGYEYIGVSDHSQTASYAHGLESDRLEKQKQEIRALQKKFKIKIFHGVESDILQDGSLDYPTAILKELDFVVASVHSRFKMDESAMNARLKAAMTNPFTAFWGHPTGRLLLGRSGYPVHWAELLKIMKKNDVALELNANPQRLDFDWRLGAMIEESGVRVSINPDAHSVEGLMDTQWGEWMMEKAMIPSKQILNLLPADGIEEHLTSRKGRLL